MNDPFTAVANPIPTEIHDLPCRYVNQTYRLFVSVPASYPNSQAVYPVLYLLDGNLNYPLARPIVELLQVAQAVPEIIIVGIGYPTATYMDTVTLRGRDLTHRELTADEKSGGYPFEETGGGPTFLKCMTHAIIPFIDATFRTDTRNRALFGWSLAAGFSLYTAFQQPGLFQSMIVVSLELDQFLRDLEATYAREHSALPLRLFLGLESTDTEADRQWIDEIREFVRVLENRSYPGLQVRMEVFPGEIHASVGPVAMLHGLRDIYREGSSNER